jgi:AcrR family transcriptional regulator
MNDSNASPSNRERQARIKARSLERRERRREELRRHILEAATQVFVDHGYDGFSMYQVAEAIGYSTPTIYLHFKDREDLLFMVVWQGYLKMSEHLEVALHGTVDPLEKVKGVLRAYLHYAIEYPAHYRAHFMATPDWLTRLAAQARAREAEGGSTPRALFTEAARAAITAGKIRAQDERETVDMLWTLAHGLASLHLSTQGITPRWDRATVERRLEDWMEVLLLGLQPRGSAGAG